MKRMNHSKSGMFLMELIIDILLFTLLCGCSLIILSKSTGLSKDSIALQQATTICSNVAAIYEQDSTKWDNLSAIYPEGVLSEDCFTIFFDEAFHSCSKEDGVYSLVVRPQTVSVEKIDILFYNEDESVIYTISACKHDPITLKEVQEGDYND